MHVGPWEWAVGGVDFAIRAYLSGSKWIFGVGGLDLVLEAWILKI